jgi:hypothetical protein
MDYEEPSLKQSLYDILNGLQSEKNLRETGEGLTRLRSSIPGVAESVGRGALASIPGVVGDISEFARTYAPQTMNDIFGARAFNTTREILNNIPRITPTHEGAETLEDVGAAISPGVGGVTKDVLKLGKGLPVGLSIKDVSKEAQVIDELGFHSTLENAVNNIGQPKGTGEQFLKQLEKTPGVKTEELEITGLKKYLQEKPTVTKQEVQDLIKSNKLKLENKVLGESTGDTAGDYRLEGGNVYDDFDYIDSLTEDLHSDLKNDPDIYHQTQQELVERFPELYEGHESDTNVAKRLNDHVEESLREQAQKQAQEIYYDDPILHYYDEHGYDVYGNENMGYSVRDPNRQFLDIGTNNWNISDVENSLREHHLEQGNLSYEGNGARYEDYTLPGRYKNYREILTTLPDKSQELSRELDDLMKFKNKNPGEWTNHLQNEYEAIRQQLEGYTEGHYGETPNVLAHMRVNDRNINGKKTLMVEEIQSDWHQAGRKHGYASDIEKKLSEIKKQREFLWDEKIKYQKLAEPYVNEGKDAPPDIVEGWTKAANGLQELDKQQNALGRGGVPDAPFKKNWHELMVKQALDMAAKGDYDAVAFTTGRQQVERYENQLRQAVDKIEFSKGYPPDTITIQGVKNGRNTFEGTVKDGKFIDGPGKGKTIEEVLGKGLAKQIEEHPGGELGVIQGKDLTIGGEGMKGFYDKILPDFVNKHTKKWGMALKKEHLTPPDNDRFLNFKDWANEKDPSLNDTFLKHSWVNQDDLYKEFLNADRKGPEIHFLELSDAAKKDIKEKGQPLFAGIGLAAPAMYPDDQKKHGILKDIAKSKK